MTTTTTSRPIPKPISIATVGDIRSPRAEGILSVIHRQTTTLLCTIIPYLSTYRTPLLKKKAFPDFLDWHVTQQADGSSGENAKKLCAKAIEAVFPFSVLAAS